MKMQFFGWEKSYFNIHLKFNQHILYTLYLESHALLHAVQGTNFIVLILDSQLIFSV